jgi:hypothetical protein
LARVLQWSCQLAIEGKYSIFGEKHMALSKYLMIALIIVAAVFSMSRLPKTYEAATIGATVGGIAGVVLATSTPLGLLGGVVVGGWLGDQLDTSTASKQP